MRGFLGGRYWVRTSDLFGVNEARYHCANRPCTRRLTDPGRNSKIRKTPEQRLARTNTESQRCNSQNPRQFKELAPVAYHSGRSIWSFPEPPIKFLLVGKRRNAPCGQAAEEDHADVAQLVEHHLAKVDVASSNLVVRSQDTVTALTSWNVGNRAYTVGWPRGEAAACKAVYTGSNPVPTSVKTLVSGPGRIAFGRLAQR